MVTYLVVFWLLLIVATAALLLEVVSLMRRAKKHLDNVKRLREQAEEFYGLFAKEWKHGFGRKPKQKVQ